MCVCMFVCGGGFLSEFIILDINVLISDILMLFIDMVILLFTDMVMFF